jgi:hypothetical protein
MQVKVRVNGCPDHFRFNEYPVGRINMFIESMPQRIEASIADNGGNNFNF